MGMIGANSVFNNNILRGWEMVTLFAGYKLIVLTRMVWSGCALAMGIVIGKYRPTKGFKNMAQRVLELKDYRKL